MLSLDTSELEQYPEWKALLTELLEAIAKRLTSIADYTSFRSVCRSWRSAAPLHNFDRHFPRAPRLIYFVEEETPVLDDDEETLVPGDLVTNFLDLESNTSQITNFPPPPPKYYPSCSGWILVSEDTQVCLKHFLLGISINLPGLNTLWNSFITKMVLSGSPMEAEADLVVMVIWGVDDQLAFCRPGDECWTAMAWWYAPLSDIIYHNSKLYALDFVLTIVECDIHGSNPTKLVQVFAFPPNHRFGSYELQFLVESYGKFLIVLHCVSENYYSLKERHHFRVFEIELKDGSYEEIDNLGDRCLFLGLSSSFCVASSRVKLKPNCIYLANKRLCSWIPIVGVYKLGGGCFEDFSDMLGLKKCNRFPSPFWAVPSI